MKANLIRIGNSRGIRLPKSVIEQCELGEEVILTVKEKKVVISSPKKARRDWTAKLEKISKSRPISDESVFDSIEGDETGGDWEW